MGEIFLKNYKSQIWVETAIYTLIGLTIIAIVLSIATPQIEKMKERTIIKQTFTALNELNNEIQNIEQNAGNVKIVFFKIAQGKLDIDSKQNKIIYTLENTNLEFSEEGERIKEGDIVFQTEKYGQRFNIILELDFSDTLNITFNNKNEIRTLYGATSPYEIRIENVGDNPIGDKTHIDFQIV